MNDFRVEKLSNNHSNSLLSKFKSDDNFLNQFISRKAKKHQEQLLAVTYLVFFDGLLVGYFSVLNETLKATDKEKEKYHKGKQYETFPALKIGRLAIQKDFESKGLGSLIIGYIKYKFANNQTSGCRYLTLDSYNTPKNLNFYKKNGFEIYTEEDKNGKTRYMYYDLLLSKE